MRRNLAIAFVGFLVLAGASTFLSACNTVAGAGKDVSATGAVVTDTAKDHR